MKFILLLFFQFVSGTNCFNILGVFPYQGKSHFFVFRVLLRELANRGHNVTAVTYFPEQKPVENYHEVLLNSDALAVEESMAVSSSYLDILKVGFYLADTGVSNCEHLLQSDQVKKLASQKFDVVLIEKFNSDCAHGLAYRIGAPIVGVTSHVAMPYHYATSGIPYNPAYVPFHFLGGGTKPTLLQRVERTAFGVFYKLLFFFVTHQNQNVVSKHLGEDVPPLYELASQMKFMLLYHNFALTGTRAFPSNVIEVGGYHVEKPKPLPKDLQKFLDNAKHGVVYISFGSMVKPSTISPDKKKAILDTLATLPQKFIWKWDDDSLPIDESKLYIGKWLPQADILAHPNTVAFVSHAGMLGTTEAVHYGVPIVAMPMFGDQPSNAAAIEESGAGVQISVNDLSKETFSEALGTVLRPEFRARAQLVSKAWRDRPLSPMDTAVFWIEYAAKYPDFNFTSPLAHVPFYQERNWDVIAVFAVLIGLLIIAIKKLCSSICGKPKTVKPNKKRKTK